MCRLLTSLAIDHHAQGPGRMGGTISLEQPAQVYHIWIFQSVEKVH